MAPATAGGRWLAVLTLPACFLYMNHNVNEVAQTLAERSLRHKLDRLLHIDLSLKHLMELDLDGDGSVSEYEMGTENKPQVSVLPTIGTGQEG
jgi:hypothetical protein